MSNLARNLLLILALSALPVASHAGTGTPAFSGPPEKFAGLYTSGRTFLGLKLAAAGKFTGVLDFANGEHTVLKGTFSAAGSYSGTTPLTKTPYILQVTGSSPSTYLLTATALTKTITAYPAAYAKGDTAAEEGYYTAIFSGTSSSATVPQGFGYSTVTVSNAGAVKMAGKLGDGTPFTSSGFIVSGTAGHEAIVYDRNLYKTNGVISGELGFFDSGNGERANGTFGWQKPPVTGSYYAAGFNTSVNVAALPYSKAVGIPFTSGTLTISGGGLTSFAPVAFAVSNKGVITSIGPNVNKSKIAINKASGAISGSFDILVSKGGKAKTGVIKFSGLLQQDGASSIGAGCFVGPVVSGTGLSGGFSLP